MTTAVATRLRQSDVVPGWADSADPARRAMAADAVARRARTTEILPVQVVNVPNVWQPADGRETINHRWRPELTVADCVPPAAKGTLVVTRGGARVEPEDWALARLEPGEILLCVHVPRALATVITGIKIAAAIYSAWDAWDSGKRAKIQSHHAARRAAAKAQQMEDSFVYGFEGIFNSITPGRPIPILYGRHRIGGIYVYVEPRSRLGVNTLDAVILISEGQILGIVAGTIEINDAPLAFYTGIDLETRNGTLNQAPFTKLWPAMIARTQNQPGNLLDSTGASPTPYLSQPNRTGFKFLINTPDGVGAVDGSSNAITAAHWIRINYQVRYRSFPSGAFGAPETFSFGWVRNGIPRPNYVVHKSNQLATDRYELEITVTSIQVSGGGASSWDTAKRIVLQTMLEFNELQQIFPQKALIGFKALATEALGGGLPKLTAEADGLLVRVYRRLTNPILTSSLTASITSGGNTLSDGTVNFTTSDVQIGDIVTITDTVADDGTYRVVSVDSTTQLTLQNTDGSTLAWVNTDGSVSHSTASTLGFAFTEEFSQNPAWVVLDILGNPDHGAGEDLSYEEDFDLESFVTSSEFCDELLARGLTNPLKSGTGTGTTAGASNVFAAAGEDFNDGVIRPGDTLEILTGPNAGNFRIDTIPTATTVTVSTVTGGAVSFTLSIGLNWEIRNTERRAQTDHYFDGTTSAWEAARSVAQNARCAVFDSSGRTKMVPDRSSATTASFNMGNIMPGSFKVRHVGREDAANRVEVQFLDRDKGYVQSVAEMEDPEALINGDPIRKVLVEAFGVVRRTQAMRIALYIYLSNRIELAQIEFETAEYLGLEWGDVIRFNHDVFPRITRSGERDPRPLEAGRVLSGSTASLVVLDRSVDIDSGGSNTEMFIRYEDDLSSGVSTADPSIVGTRTHLFALPVPLAKVPVEGDIWSLGPALIDDPDPALYKIIAITRSGRLRRTIRAVTFRDSLYTEADLIGNFPDNDI